MKDCLRILDSLESLNFKGKAEAFVEQKFVTPLLECLGYDSDDDYEVKRHGDSDCSFKLSYPPVENGAKKVKHYNPDYIPTLRKQMFWVIEAKSPSVKYPFHKKYLVQGLQYCIHPEIQACYLVVSNGVLTSIYDAQNSVFFEGDIYTPIFSFKNTELITKWKTIYKYLSAEKMRFSLEERLKKFYEKLSLTSLNEAYPESLIQYIGRNTYELKNQINANLINKWGKTHDRKFQLKINEMRNFSDEELEIRMNHPSGWENKIIEIFLERKLKIFSEIEVFDICINDYQDCSIFKKENYFRVLSDLYIFSKDDELKDRIKKFLLENVFKKLNIINQVEARAVRVFRKLTVINNYESLRQAISLYVRDFPEIIQFGRKPNPTDFTYPHELMFHDVFFSYIKKLPESELTDLKEKLEHIENEIEEIFKKEKSRIPYKDMEVSGLEKAGYNDMICSLKNIICNKGLFEFSCFE